MCSVKQDFSTALVSVIIPAYNAALLIEETLRSILEQTYSNVEIIVVDDGSTDETVKVVEALSPGIRIFRQLNSGGCSSPRNHGLRLAHGEFVAFFDADDIMVPTKLERQVAFMQYHPECDAVLMDYRNFDENGVSEISHFETCKQLLATPEAAQGPEFILPAEVATRILITENYAIAGSPLMRRSIFQRLEPFDENLKASEDFDLIYRIADHSGLGVVREVGFLRRLHEANMSKRTTHILKYKLASRHKLLDAAPANRNRKLLLREIAGYHLSLAEFSARQDPGFSLQHLWSALRLGYPPDMRVAKSLAKCAVRALSTS